MSHLKALKLTSAVAVRATVDPVQRSREKMVAALAEQKQMAEAKIAGRAFTPTHVVRKKNAEGVRVEVEAPSLFEAGGLLKLLICRFLLLTKAIMPFSVNRRTALIKLLPIFVSFNAGSYKKCPRYRFGDNAADCYVRKNI